MKIVILIMLVMAIATMAHLGGPLAIERIPLRQRPRRNEENLDANA
jgi:hypothetical protein